MCGPGWFPVQELAVCCHSFVMPSPPMFYHWIQHSLHQSKPVSVHLAKFEVIQFIFHCEARFIQKGFPSSRAVVHAFVLYIIVFDSDQGCSCQHREWDKNPVQSHLNEAVREHARVRVKHEGGSLCGEDFRRWGRGRGGD